MRTHHSFRPLVHDLHQPELEPAELLARDLVRVLHPLDAVRDREDRVAPLFELRRHDGLAVGFLLKDEGGEERGDLVGLVSG